MNSRILTDIVPRIDFAWWETAVMRAGFAILLLRALPPLSALPASGARLSFPNGLAKWVDLTWALDPAAYSLLTILLENEAAALYILGFCLSRIRDHSLSLLFGRGHPAKLARFHQPLLSGHDPGPARSVARLLALGRLRSKAFAGLDELSGRAAFVHHSCHSAGFGGKLRRLCVDEAYRAAGLGFGTVGTCQSNLQKFRRNNTTRLLKRRISGRREL